MGHVNFWEEDWSNKSKTKMPTRRLRKEDNNRRMEDNAEIHAWEMRNNPSWLEKQMMEFLDNHNIKYEFQKIFYISGKDGYKQRYFIADFFIQDRNLIIEMDGKQHKNNVEYDNKRTALIKKHYRKVKVVRFTYKDITGMEWENILKRINTAAYSNYRKERKKIKKEENKIKARPSTRVLFLYSIP